jgi:hypothetical protein
MKKFLALLLVSFNLYAQQVLHFDAQYKIPVNAPELESYSLFELENYTVYNDGKNSRITYELPFAMTGLTDQKVELKLAIEKLPLRVFESPRAIALCEGPWPKMKCSMKFKAINMHYGRLHKDLVQQGLPAEEIEARMSVLRSFGTEPIGETFIKPAASTK